MHGFLARLVSNDMRVDGLFFILPRTSSADKLFTGGNAYYARLMSYDSYNIQTHTLLYIHKL